MLRLRELIPSVIVMWYDWMVGYKSTTNGSQVFHLTATLIRLPDHRNILFAYYFIILSHLLGVGSHI